ncbi:copper amine oxidase N-terminal domain-containing protein [Peptococcaceae bacterium 1198_IL3148]
MKNRIFLTLVAFLFLFSASFESASASVGVKNVNAHYNNIKINVDGSYVNTTNEPFTIYGITYVPLREISNILNAEVRWDAENNIIFIKSGNNSAVANSEPKVMANTSDGTQKVNIHYNNIKINVDGKYVNTANEPFTISGVTYVPLREISNILDAEVDWDGENNTVLIYSSSNESVDISEPIDDESIDSVDSSEPEETGDKPVGSIEPKDENTLFAELLFDKYGKLESVDFEKFELSGDKRDINLNIYLNLANNTDTWNALTDRNINDWLEDIIEDIQKKFDKDTEVTGKVIRVSNLNVLLDFDKDGDANLKSRFYDANYRTGVEVKSKAKPLDNNYVGKHYYVDNLDFITTAATYGENFGQLDIVLTATKANTTFDWDKYSTRDINAHVMVVCDKVVGDYDGEIEDLKQINLNFKDKSNSQIALFRYDVNEEKFLR